MPGDFLKSILKAKRYCESIIAGYLFRKSSLINRKIKAGNNKYVVPGFDFYKTWLLPSFFRIIIFISFLAAFSISSCQTAKKQKQHVKTSTFNYENGILTAQIIKERIIYRPDSLLDLYINLFLNEIPSNDFTKINSSANKTQNYTLRYLILKDQKTNNILDSGVVTFKAQADTKSYYQYQFQNLNIKNHKEFIVRIELYDFTRHINYIHTRWVNLNLAQGDTKFLLYHLPDSQPYLNNYFTRKDSFIINSGINKPLKLFLLYSSLTHKAAAPPFYISDEKEKIQIFRTDSVLSVNDKEKLKFYYTGNYLLKTDTLQKVGLWLNCFMNGFPNIVQPQDFSDPLIYITSRNEFINLQNTADKKLGAYNFWYSALGSTSRGEMAADVFYKRVKQANELFTSFKEGWKTDRGMIFIVFGRPDVIYKEKEGENWVYNENNFFPGAKFIFNRIPEPWGDEFILVRNENLRNSWYIAVDSWRRGRLKF